LRADARFEPLAAGPPELDIVAWKLKANAPEESSRLALQVFDACAVQHLHLALVQLPLSWFVPPKNDPNTDALVTCLRSVLMKPEHQAWLDQIWQKLSAVCAEIDPQ
jgi:hypothetical protein